MTNRRWPRCTCCGSRLPEGAPGTPITTPIPPPPVEFARILESHVLSLRTAGRRPIALRINDVEAGRCGITDMTDILGHPVFRDNSLPPGRACLRLFDGTLYEFALPVYFTED